MRLWNKIIGLGVGVFFSINSFAEPLLTNYIQLVRALENAEVVTGIIHLDRCILSDPSLLSSIATNIENATTRVNFTRYIHYNARIDGQLRNLVETADSIVVEHTEDVFYKIFTNLKIFDDNRGFYHIHIYDQTHKKKVLVLDMECDISNGRDDNGLYLYDVF